MLRTFLSKQAVFCRPIARSLSGKAASGRLQGRTVVVCGAGNDDGEAFGIGKMTAIVCAREGANVVAVSNNAAHAEGTAAAIRADASATGDAIGVTADCTSPADVAALVEKTVDTFGSVNSLINAGVYDAQPNGFGKLDAERWLRSMDLNLHAQFYLIDAFLPTMTSDENGGGSLVFVSTIAGSVGLGAGQQRHGYAAGKAGASALTKRIGVEYAKAGVRGNVVEAGYIASPLVTRAVEQAGADLDAVTATRDSYVPRGVQGQPVDVAYACAWLASDEAAFINGVTLPVDGGTSSVTYGP